MVEGFANALFLPPRVGPGLCKCPPHRELARKVEVDSAGFFTALVDGFNALQLSLLEERLPGDGYRLSFVRGSVICDRLQQADHLVARAYELFELPQVFDELSKDHAVPKIEALDRTLRRELIIRLLQTRGSLGPTKLVFRLRAPDIAEAVAGGVEPANAFLRRIALQYDDVSEEVQGILEESGLGRSEPTVAFALDQLLRGAHRDALAIRCQEGGFGVLLEVLHEERSLHPLLRLSDRAVPRVASALEIEGDAARELVTWLRIGSLLQSRTHEDLSDLSLKNLVVVPSPEIDPVAARKHAERALEQARLALEEAIAAEPHLKDLGARYPEVRRSASAFALVLPKPLYEIFAALEIDQRVTFVTRLQIGRLSLTRYLRQLHRADAEIIQAAWLGVCFLRLRAKKPGQRKVRQIHPGEITPESLRFQLDRILSDERDAPLRSLAGELNRIMKDDRAAVVRGLWS